MKANYITANAGNIAIEEQMWVLDEEARKATLNYFIKERNERIGSYWHNTVIKALRSRKGDKKIRTGGFTSAEFSNILFNIGV
jgi:hypothetical protein